MYGLVPLWFLKGGCCSRYCAISTKELTVSKEELIIIYGTGDEILRKVEGVTKMDRIRSDDIRGRLKQEDVLETVLRRKKKISMYQVLFTCLKVGIFDIFDI